MRNVIGLCLTAMTFPILLLVATLARNRRNPIQVGFGPDPLINNIQFVKALKNQGISAESYCVRPYYICDDFDRILIERPPGFLASLPPRKLWCRIWGFVWSIRRYEILAISCNGGLLGGIPILRALEPLLLKLSKTRTLVLPYGSDVQDLTRNPNKEYRDALLKDYPDSSSNNNKVRRQIRRWTRHADFIINGCDWIDYLDRSDTLTIGHFAIDTSEFSSSEGYSIPGEFTAERPLKVLHAPNHPNIKGTPSLISAIRNLESNGHPIELTVASGVSARRVRELIEESDLVVDQLVIGWYAMFCIEAMALSRPVICRIRKDLEHMYISRGLLQKDELPQIRSDTTSIEGLLLDILNSPEQLTGHALRGRDFVEQHHSLDAMGPVLAAAVSCAGDPIRQARRSSIMRDVKWTPGNT